MFRYKSGRKVTIFYALIILISFNNLICAGEGLCLHFHYYGAKKSLRETIMSLEPVTIYIYEFWQVSKPFVMP